MNDNLSPMTLSEQSFLPDQELIFIPEVDERVFDFISKIWHSFVNKTVSLTFTDRDYCFDYGLFEVIDGKATRIAAVSSQVTLGDIASKRYRRSYAQFKKMTRSTPVSYREQLNIQYPTGGNHQKGKWRKTSHSHCQSEKRQTDPP